MVAAIHKFVESKQFQYGILGLILAAAVLAGLETDPVLETNRTIDVLNAIVIWAFVVEAVLKMAQYGGKFYKYFFDPWNVADFIITILCLVPMLPGVSERIPIDTSMAAVLRLARVVRALRLVTTVPRLQLIANSMIKSIPSMFYVGILLFLIFFIYGVMGVHLFRKNDPVHFRNLPSAMLTLFRVVTLEEWTAIMDTQMHGSQVFDDYNGLRDDARLPESEPTAYPVIAPVYFISFIFLGTMVMLNLFIGIIVGSMSEAQEENQKQHLKDVEASGRGPTLNDTVLAMEAGIDTLKKQLEDLRLRLENDAEARTAADEVGQMVSHAVSR